MSRRPRPGNFALPRMTAGTRSNLRPALRGEARVPLVSWLPVLPTPRWA